MIGQGCDRNGEGRGGCGDPTCRKCYEYSAAVPEAKTAIEGRKDDQQKPMWHLLPYDSISKVVEVLTYGAKKYAPDNWRKVPDGRARYFAATQRHLAAWWGGEEIDPESKLPHLAHAACCLLFLLSINKK